MGAVHRRGGPRCCQGRGAAELWLQQARPARRRPRRRDDDRLAALEDEREGAVAALVEVFLQQVEAAFGF
jgi:hypothetical protein